MTQTWMRHPVPDAAPGLCYGHLDVGWGALAQAQVDAAMAILPNARTVWSSPLRRCRDLAEQIASRGGCSVTYDPRLREMHFGVWEGQFWDCIDRAESDPWAADYWRIAPPGGESFSAVHSRVADALASIPENAIVVTHAGVIRAVQMIVTGATLEQVFTEAVPYAQPLTFLPQAA